MKTALKLPFAGGRGPIDGVFGLGDSYGFYWSSSPYNARGYSLGFYASYISPSFNGSRAHGLPVRCFKN